MVRIFSTKGTKLVEIAKERFLLESEVQQLTGITEVTIRNRIRELLD
jgi:transcription initiation factor TFIIIB Brf1 subunit/transcription initiation factor TFIIB